MYNRVMNLPRCAQVAGNQAQVFHVMSRVVDKRKVFEDVEKTAFLNMMRQFEAFSGVEILAYCLMGNHFHIMLHVPLKPDSISDEEVWDRMAHIYTKDKLKAFKVDIEQNIARGYTDYEKVQLDKMRDRMFSLSMYMKDLKQKFTKWFNRYHGRKGTLWEERFKSVLVEGNLNAMMKTAAYIELNPVRAGIVKNTVDYRWCSYTAAVAGNTLARKGITQAVGGLACNREWEEIELIYRQYFTFRLSENVSDKDEDQKPMSAAEAMLVRIRYFTEGYIIGSKEFIEQHFNSKKEMISPNRKKICNKIPGGLWDELHSFRDVR